MRRDDRRVEGPIAVGMASISVLVCDSITWVMSGGATSYYAVKKPLCLVVCLAGETRVFRADGDEMTIQQAAGEFPELAAVLPS